MEGLYAKAYGHATKRPLPRRRPLLRRPHCLHHHGSALSHAVTLQCIRMLCKHTATAGLAKAASRAARTKLSKAGSVTTTWCHRRPLPLQALQSCCKPSGATLRRIRSCHGRRWRAAYAGPQTLQGCGPSPDLQVVTAAPAHRLAGLLGQLLGVRSGRGLGAVALRERRVVLAHGHVSAPRGGLVEVDDGVRVLRGRVVRCARRSAVRVAFRVAIRLAVNAARRARARSAQGGAAAGARACAGQRAIVAGARARRARQPRTPCRSCWRVLTTARASARLAAVGRDSRPGMAPCCMQAAAARRGRGAPPRLAHIISLK